MEHGDSKKVQCLLLDRMSNLPSSIIETILTRLPMRDAFRTSILSRNWRDRCFCIPKLVFDDKLFEGSVNARLSVKCKLLHVVYPILLLHDGPLLDFTLSISQLQSCYEIDQIILHLLRNNTVEKFTLHIDPRNGYKLPSSLYLLRRLTHLDLQSCAFWPPPSFNGFSSLTSLCFINVNITAKMLLLFISNCPLLKSFSLIEDDKHFTGGKFDFVDLFHCMPLIAHLCMSSYPIKCFAAGGIPDKLPTLLVHLRILNLSGLCFAREDELSSALFLIRSSPSIEKMKIEMNGNPNVAVSQAALTFFELQDDSDISLDHLKEVEITNYTNLKPELEFVKLILAKSSMLKKVRIAIDHRAVPVNIVIQMLKDLLEFPRASTKAVIKFERL